MAGAARRWEALPGRGRRAAQELAALTDGTSRYDTARDGVWALLLLAVEGHRGVAGALDELEAAYHEAVADESNRDPTEWDRMIRNGVEKVHGMDSSAPHGEVCPDRDADPGSRPRLDITNGADLLDDMREQMGSGPLEGLFLRGDHPIQVRDIRQDGYCPPIAGHDSDGPAPLLPIDAKALRLILQVRYWTFKLAGPKDARTEVHSAPTVQSCEDVVRAAVHGECPNLPVLRSVVHTPLVRTDGSIFNSPGYDAESRLLFLPNGLVVPPVPARPTRRDVSAARGALLRLVDDFPFESDSDCTNYLGLMLTPLLRLLVPGPRPLGIIHAHMAGSGKTLLSKMIGLLYGSVSRSEPSDSDEEIRKTVTSLLLTTTAPVVVFDNVRRVLRSAVLEKLLTDDEWSDRVLGQNKETARLPNDRLWLVTGNNVKLGGDLLRRAVWVNIDPDSPRPWDRTEWAIPDLLGEVKRRRGEILAALLTLVRAWVLAGRPADSDRSDAYAEWASTVSGVLEHARVPGAFWAPGTNRAVIGADDDDWGTFLAAVHAEFEDAQFTCKEVVERTYVSERLNEAMPDEIGQRTHGPSAKSLGKWFSNREGRFAGSHVARSAGNDGHGTKRWLVQVVGGSDDR